MARKPSETTTAATDNTLEVLPALTEAANALHAHSSAIAQQYGDGLPYDRTRLIHETRFYMAQSAEAMLEAGKRLIIMKENEPHGDFMRIAEESLGLSYVTANKMMNAAVKFSNPKLAKLSTSRTLNKSKLLELMMEDDEALEALADGGTVAGLTLDDIDRMTSRELRTSLRESRENAEAQSRLLSDKNAKIDELVAKKTRIKPLPPDEEGAEIRKEASLIAFEAEAVIRGNLRSAFETIASHSESHDIPHDNFMSGLLAQIEHALNQLRGEFDVKTTPDGEVMPDWLRDPEVDRLVQEAETTASARSN
jgi:hypothetical protein